MCAAAVQRVIGVDAAASVRLGCAKMHARRGYRGASVQPGRPDGCRLRST